MFFSNFAPAISNAVSSIKKPSFLDNLAKNVGIGISEYQKAYAAPTKQYNPYSLKSPVITGKEGKTNYMIIGGIALVAMVILLK